MLLLCHLINEGSNPPAMLRQRGRTLEEITGIAV